ncbi:unnamed protein product [Trypanosoma congolense IL3000]|uniref:WGS project CAEQ00000000 data, annotated contig 1128 n=1 Tax=Trypanosoma congolense (strain IL3000) TaxID=1068625 RepID=F9W3Y8_TRYCI|nr:unnamed protein product [Trypanosoma congolense IL3000]
MLRSALTPAKRVVWRWRPGVSTAAALSGAATACPHRHSATTSAPITKPAPIHSEDDWKLVPERADPTAAESKMRIPAEPEGRDPLADDGARDTSSGVSLPAGHYAPWEIRALLLPLIPADGSSVHISHIIHLLPSAARQEMGREGSPLEYVEKHLSDGVTVKGGMLSRHTLAGGHSRGETPGGKCSVSPPPPPIPVGRAASQTLPQQQGANPRGGSGRTTLEVLDTLIEFIPTFFVQHQMVADQLPSEITRQFADSSFLYYLKRFRHYIDIRANHGHTEIRLRPDFSHPKRGEADTRYAAGLNNSDMLTQLARGRRPPRHSEANLIHFIVPRMPTRYTAIASVLQDVSDIVSRHPSFDPRLGVMGLFEKYPEYFQIVDSKLRVRPFRSAPNSLDDLNATTSPLPDIYAKVKQLVDMQAEGKDYSKEAEKAQAVVPTGKLYALLTSEEKLEVKKMCRSFPRFLRLHGEEIVVSVDSMKVYKFCPTYEPCAETLMDQRLMMGSLSPNDPVLKIPAAMEESTSADWAVRELYDALPLIQCAELDEVMSLVPPSVRAALPQDHNKLVEHLMLYPDYFATWPYPDDPTVTVVQRGMLEPPQLGKEDIVRMVLSLIPQGGIEAHKLMRRVPLPLQRYFYRYGLKKVLGEFNDYFLIVSDKVMRVG